MDLVKKIVAWGCLSWAALLAIFMVVIAFDPEESPQEKREIGLGLLILGAPPAVVGIGLLTNLRGSHQKRLEEQDAAQEERLRRIVYELAAADSGRVTAFKFAQVAQLPADEAKAYLDQCAQDFGADYDFTDAGEIIYRFPT
ncbi:MAG: hypothetical protein HC812_10460 [Leptolyngbya sp. RL_3_1]|nr:hypothetical protein [Leptolyngbya sp. RL_3_1]